MQVTVKQVCPVHPICPVFILASTNTKYLYPDIQSVCITLLFAPKYE